tara:strand:- start:44 stop:2164 length:2121 start_codon:yes stop_codon:yes gene_type:complete
MRISLLVIFSIFLVSSVVLVSSVQNSFADEVVATSIGFEDSTILELKNIRGGTEKIDSVRVWLSGENEFKSFKTEQGWTGMNTPQGVIIFSSQNEINPGEKVKFGIKTLKDNPVINWKAVNAEGQVISSASTKITISDDVDEKPGFNESKVVGINEESNFRFIPEKPSSNSDFRVIGEGFVPNESLDFYIGKELQKTIKIDKDGKILFTSKTPIVKNDERVEFVLTDSGGNEKSLSIRIPETENREISQIIKLSLGNTEKEVKRGEMVMLEGMATPNTTLTITSKHSNGDILNIDIIKVGFDGKWKHDNLFGPELELGTLSIEITDGKTTVLRNVDIISAKVINISTSETRYEKGDIIKFEGSAIANQDMSVILEDAIGAEIFSRVISVGETGKVDFEIEIPRGAVEGTYVLLSYQENEEGITIFGVGQEPESILVVRTPKLNFAAGETANIMIQGPSNAQVAIIVIDSADREKFSDTINLGPDGKGIYEIDTDDLANGSYTLNAKRGESSGSVVFTIGLTTGSGAISIQTTRDEYRPGDQILILGNTGSINVLLDITIRDSDGKTIKKIETFSDRFGVFKIDNFRIPNDAILGTWEVNAKSGGNFKSFFFEVKGEKQYITVDLDRNNYRANDLMTVSGDGARNSSTVTIKIYNSEGVQINELNITAKGNGDYSTIWQVPGDLEVGEYEIMVDDGSTNSSITFIIE